MKKIFTSLFVLTSVVATAQSNRYDSVAVLIMDRMTDVIGDLGSCSFRLYVANDVGGSSNALIKYFSEYEVFMSGPDKMLVNVHGQNGHRQFMYNGRQVAFYDFDEQNYGVIPAPCTTLKMIDSLNQYYGIEFPAADFFYPAFTDDLLEDSDSLRFVGMERIGSKEYFHLISFGKEMDTQFWISNDAYNLPARFSICYKNREGRPQYLALFSDWELNPSLPSAMFNFLPPPNATQVRMISKTEMSKAAF